MAEPTVRRIGMKMSLFGSPVSGIRLVWATGLAGILAVVATSLVYSTAAASGFVDRDVLLPSLLGSGPLSLASVSVTALAASVAAGMVLGILALVTRKPVRNFRIVATVLAVLSLSMPATIQGPPAVMRLTMATMHVLVWAISIGVLATVAAWRGHAPTS